MHDDNEPETQTYRFTALDDERTKLADRYQMTRDSEVTAEVVK